MVNFGDYINAIINSSKYKDKYINYNELKKALGKLVNRKMNATEDFYRQLDENYNSCRGFAGDWLIRLETDIEIGVYTSTAISDALELNQFVFVNQEALRKIIKKHDKNMPYSRLLPVWRYKMDFFFTQRIIDVMFGFIKLRPKTFDSPTKSAFSKLLTSNSSDQISLTVDANEFSEMTDIPHSLNKQEDSFVRQSTKYWVKPVDLVAVCTILSEHLSVHAFDNSSPWTPISSVYLDNSSRECFSERIRKDSGARIIRLRTYNNDLSKVYIERKVHHEKWTGDTSSKDRFALDESQVMLLLRGQQVKVADKFKGLKTELQSMITDRKLFPTLRVDYTRIAFQPENHDHVRISIDLNMQYLQEKCSHMEWYTPDEKLDAEDQLLFPYSVVEIKLREPYISSPPKWLEDLEKSALLHKENNFSKYIHGTYAFSALNGNTLKLVKPVWWDAMSFVSPLLPLTSITSETEWEKSSKVKRQGQEYDNQHWLPKFLGFKVDKDSRGAPVKIEPKVFFANERTFLSWFQSSLFVSSIGVALSTDPHAYILGILLIAVGLLLIGYASLTYLQRVNSLLNRKSSGYHDKFGPIFLTSVISFVFVITIIVSIKNASKL